MENLVIKSKDGFRDVTTSIIVAEVFGKRHADVLRDIRNLSCSKDFHERNFALSFNFRPLPNSGSTKDSFYEITKDGFSFLVMGYTGEKAAQFKEDFIREFNNREMLLKSDEYILSRALEISSTKLKRLEESLSIKDYQLEVAQTIIKETAPKAEYYDEVLQGKEGITTTIIAKDLNMSAIALNLLLHKYGVIFKSQDTWVLYQKYVNRGYTVSKTFTHRDSSGKILTEIQTYWTEKGRQFIMENVKKVQKGSKF